MKRIVAAGCVVLHQLHPSLAFGCGSTPDMLSPLLPAVEATDVPLDAVLFAASNHSHAIAFELRRETLAPSAETSPGPVDAGGAVSGETITVETAASDTAERALPPLDGETADTQTAADSTAAPDPVGTAPVQVPLDVTCYPASGGNLCVAKPTILLEPGTRYSWQTWTNVDADLGLATPPRGFTTGVAIADVGLPQVSVEVDDYRVFSSHPCGQTSAVDMTVTASGLTTPLVVNVEGVTPAYVHEPLVLTVDAPEQAFGLSSPPACFVIETFDVTGARAEVGEICPKETPPATPDVAPAGSTPEAPADPAWSGAGATPPAAAETEGPIGDSASLPPREVERRAVPTRSGSGCAVALGGVGQSVPASAWLVALALVVARRCWRRCLRRE